MTPQAIDLTAAEARWEETYGDSDAPNPRRVLVRVLVLDDEEGVLEDIRDSLNTAGMSCDTAKNLTEFAELLAKSDYDVASLDWQIEQRIGEGGDALTKLMDDDPDIGKVAFTVYADIPAVVMEAKHLGADYIVMKQVVNYDEFTQAVRNAARLCFFRRVARSLRELGYPAPDPAGFRPRDLSDERERELERELYSAAREAVVARFWAREDDKGLMSRLKRYGVARKFDSSRFVALPFRAKLAELLKYVRATPEDVSRILEVDAETAAMIRRGEEARWPNEKLREREYCLASILSYVLRVAKREPEYMYEVWVRRGLNAKSSDPPPWDEQGLRDYLKETGGMGLNNALTWIRKY